MGSVGDEPVGGNWMGVRVEEDEDEDDGRDLYDMW